MPTTTVVGVRMTNTERAALLRLVARLNADGRRLHHRQITSSIPISSRPIPPSSRR